MLSVLIRLQWGGGELACPGWGPFALLTLPFQLILLKIAQAPEKASILHISDVDLESPWGYSSYQRSVGDVRVLFFKVYFCVTKISIFPRINLALFPTQLIL